MEFVSSLVSINVRFHIPYLKKVQQMFSLVGRHVAHVTNTFLIAW